MKRPGHKNFNAVSHNRSRPEVFFNLTWRSRGQISSVLLQLLLFALSNTKFERREMICYVLAMGKQHLGPHVVVGYGIKIFWPGLFITSPDHLEQNGGAKLKRSMKSKNSTLQQLSDHLPCQKLPSQNNSMQGLAC